MRVRVECYAGYKGSERPVRFFLGGREYQVEEIVDRWYGAEATYFKVRAADGNFYILCHHPYQEDGETWTLESFASGARHGSGAGSSG